MREVLVVDSNRLTWHDAFRFAMGLGTLAQRAPVVTVLRTENVWSMTMEFNGKLIGAGHTYVEPDLWNVFRLAFGVIEVINTAECIVKYKGLTYELLRGEGGKMLVKPGKFEVPDGKNNKTLVERAAFQATEWRKRGKALMGKGLVTEASQCFNYADEWKNQAMSISLLKVPEKADEVANKIDSKVKPPEKQPTVDTHPSWFED